MNELKKNHVVQLDPEKTRNKAFGGCFMVITEPKPWGAQGYVQGLGTRESQVGQAYYRAVWEEMSAPIGDAIWVVE